MNLNSEELHRIIAEMAILIDRDAEPDPTLCAPFFQHPEYALQLIELINNLEEQIIQDSPPIYAACIFAFDICISQLQAATEAGNKSIAKALTQLMNRLAELIQTQRHSLGYWLPILNAFYEVHVELTEALKNAYMELASLEEPEEDDDEFAHLNSIRDLIQELSDLTTFEIAEHFFAQSYAMPTEFFADLIADLYSIEEGHDIALLTLLHPRAEVREVAVATINQLIEEITISSLSLSRLNMIMYWYPEQYHPTFERWIKLQRKKGVVFTAEVKPKAMTFKATEVDGSGAQGIFVHIRHQRKHRLGGLLLKSDYGIKDTWITPAIPSFEVTNYYHQAFEESVTLRVVDEDYFCSIVAHFLAIALKKGDMPPLDFLELQELTGMRLRAQELDIDALFEQLSMQITPFTQEVINHSLKRSNNWLSSKSFTESWYIENPLIDKIVNHNSSFVEGTKVCKMDEAMHDVFVEELELHRDRWQFHFLWVTLWLKAKVRKNEKSWQDSFIIAYMIHQGTPLQEIPVIKEICRQTVINSIETMQERKTHLNQE